MFISHAIENNLHKQQCIVGHVNTMHFKILYIYIVCLQALMNVGYAHTIIISSLTDPGLVNCSRERSTFPSKEPPAEISVYGPVNIHLVPPFMYDVTIHS